LTDTFVKTYAKNKTKNEKELTIQFFSDLKRMKETGKAENLSENTRFMLDRAGISLEGMTAEQIKALPDELSDYARNLGEALQLRLYPIDNTSLNTYIERAKKWSAISIPDDISVADLKKLANDNKELFRQDNHITITDLENATEATRKDMVELLREQRDSWMETPSSIKSNLKYDDKLIEHIDLSKKSVKELPSDADFNTKEVLKVIKKTIKEMNLKSAAKWGAIGAGILGVLGLGIGAMNNKKS